MRAAHFYKAFIRLGVRQVVGDVREPRAARLELLKRHRGVRNHAEVG